MLKINREHSVNTFTPAFGTDNNAVIVVLFGEGELINRYLTEPYDKMIGGNV